MCVSIDRFLITENDLLDHSTRITVVDGNTYICISFCQFSGNLFRICTTFGWKSDRLDEKINTTVIIVG